MAVEEHDPGHARDDPIASRPDAEPSALLHRLQQALARQLRDAAAARGPAVPVELAGDRMRALMAKPRRPDTAAALALASFVPWLAHAGRLELAGIGGFRELHFAARLPTGVRGTPPVIDVMAFGPAGVVGGAVQLFDYLARRPRRPTSAYAALDLPPGLRPWGAQLGPRPAGEEPFHHADVAGLAKLAIGLGRIFAGRPARLLYLFLEPGDAGAWPPFRRHRAELARLAEATAGADVLLAPASFRELWAGWLARDPPESVRGIVAELDRRYDVATPRGAPL